MNNWPPVLLRRWLLQGLTGWGCLLVGVAMFLTVQDHILLAISGLLGVFTVLYSITLYRLIDKREYEVVEGVCIHIRCLPLCRQRTLFLMTPDGAEQVISLDRQSKIQIGNCYRAYFCKSDVYQNRFSHDRFLAIENLGEYEADQTG